MIGNEDGTVTIWSAKKALPICFSYLFFYNKIFYIKIKLDVIKAH